jgi:hypothetical protein
MNGATIYDSVCADLQAAGLTPRGGFHVGSGDDVPRLRTGSRTRSVMLAGNAGPAMWKAFSGARPEGRNPLDTWSRSILRRIADRHGAGVAMPSDGPPHAPFQRWAMHAEPVHLSPLGILIHPRWGLWHGYRGALLFADRIALPDPEALPSPCETCADRPCLSACPVAAFTDTGYAVYTCVAHLKTPEGTDCRTTGCRARHACPVGQEERYAAAQAEFHMAAFLDRRVRPA